MKTSNYWIEKLKLIPHPEGGFYKETYKNSESISDKELKIEFEDFRCLATSIYFLLNSGEVSHFHSLKSDEIWYFHDGCPLTVYVINEQGILTRHRLGLDVEKGQQPQIMVPAGSIFGSAVDEENSYSLVGCMVAFGFDFRDFKLFSRKELLKAYPQHEEIIIRLT